MQKVVSNLVPKKLEPNSTGDGTIHQYLLQDRQPLKPVHPSRLRFQAELNRHQDTQVQIQKEKPKELTNVASNVAFVQANNVQEQTVQRQQAKERELQEFHAKVKQRLLQNKNKDTVELEKNDFEKQRIMRAKVHDFCQKVGTTNKDKYAKQQSPRIQEESASPRPLSARILERSQTESDSIATQEKVAIHYNVRKSPKYKIIRHSNCTVPDAKRLLCQATQKATREAIQAAEAHARKEEDRNVEQLRQVLLQQVEEAQVQVPALCNCTKEPMTHLYKHCCNNCPFFKNPHAFAQAVQSFIKSCK